MDITTLVRAVQALNASDPFKAGLSAQHWQALEPYLARQTLRAGELLIRQGEAERSAYFVEQGNLQVFVSGGTPGRARIAILRPGSLVGEAALFAGVPRGANAEAMTPGVVWALSAARLDELCTHAPPLALLLLRAAAALMATRVSAHLVRDMPLI